MHSLVPKGQSGVSIPPQMVYVPASSGTKVNALPSPEMDVPSTYQNGTASADPVSAANTYGPHSSSDTKVTDKAQSSLKQSSCTSKSWQRVTRPHSSVWNSRHTVLNPAVSTAYSKLVTNSATRVPSTYQPHHSAGTSSTNNNQLLQAKVSISNSGAQLSGKQSMTTSVQRVTPAGQSGVSRLAHTV